MHVLNLKIHKINANSLPDYAEIPVAFEVASVLEVEQVNGGLDGIRLHEETVLPYIKDYDSYEDGGPDKWPQRFDVRDWGLFLATDEDRCVGGAAVAFDAPDIGILHGRDDVAALWDIRVRPEDRYQGVGTRLFQHAAGWASSKGLRQLRIETPNVDVPASRFYAQQGCELGEIDRYFYFGHPEVGHEIMLGWYLS